MSQHPSPHDDAEPTDAASEEAAPADPAPQEVTDPGGVTKTRKSLWMIGAGLVLLGWFILRVKRALERPEFKPAKEASGRTADLPEGVEEEVAESLEGAIAALRSGVAVDDAVVACWHRLETIAADSGMPRLPTQTSQEFTLAILGSAVVDEAALLDLASLYRRALFSTHVMGETDRERAVECLESLAGSLSVGDDA